MRIDLEARPQRSTLREILAPVAALIVAILIGGVVIALMGRSTIEAFNVYFVEPLSQSYSLQAIAVKATPLILIAVGLAFCYRANLVEHRRRRPVHRRRRAWRLARTAHA